MSDAADNPRDWSDDDVDCFARTATPEATVDVIINLAEDPDTAALEALYRFLGARHQDVFQKAIPSRAAVRALISVGEPGVRMLRRAVLDASDHGVRYKANIVESLFRAGRGEPLPWAPAAPWLPSLDRLVISDDARAAAATALRDLLADSLVDPDVFRHVAQFLVQAQLGTGIATGGDMAAADDVGLEILRLLADASIRLSPSLIDAYEALLDAADREEVYQQFFADHPEFLDPLSGMVIPKQRLGLEHATDYAIRRLDGRWLLVEIEKPSDPIFTRAYDFSAGFTHAFGQVLDFQHWVDDNVAYAQKHMEGITAPRGLLVVGMRTRLDARATAKLRRFADNSTRIDVATFDDLLLGARNLYANLVARPR